MTPRSGTHGKSWVYASPYIGISVASLCRWSDMDFGQGLMEERVYLCERYPRALESIYRGGKGAIYSLSMEKFLENQTPFRGEVVSPHSVEVLAEEVVEDVYSCISQLIEKKEIDFFRFPERPKHIPGDDSDLIEKYKKRLRPGTDRYREFVFKHPGLKERMDLAILSG